MTKKLYCNYDFESYFYDSLSTFENRLRKKPIQQIQMKCVKHIFRQLMKIKKVSASNAFSTYVRKHIGYTTFCTTSGFLEWFILEDRLFQNSKHTKYAVDSTQK